MDFQNIIGKFMTEGIPLLSAATHRKLYMRILFIWKNAEKI